MAPGRTTRRNVRLYIQQQSVREMDITSRDFACSAYAIILHTTNTWPTADEDAPVDLRHHFAGGHELTPPVTQVVPAARQPEKPRAPPKPRKDPQLALENEFTKRGAAREAVYDKVQKQLQLTRFKTPLLRGTPLGQRLNVFIPERNAGKSKRKEFRGTVTVWVTRMKDGSLMYRDWPATFKGPSTICTNINLKNYATTHEKISATIDRLVRETDALESAELAYSDTPQYGITRTEAVLATQFVQCYEQATTFLKHVNRLAKPEGDMTRWINDQHLGPAAFSRLIGAYGSKFFPSPEAVSITAAYLVQNWLGEYGQYFTEHADHIDRALYLGAKKLWSTKGTAKNRNVIVEVPISFPFIRLDAVASQECANLNLSVVTTRERLTDLSKISPIANRAIYGAKRSHVDAPGDQDRQPLLSNKTEMPYHGEHFALWAAEFYDPADPDAVVGPVKPLTVGPHKIVTDVQDHEQCAKVLRELATMLDRFSHWLLVVTVWHDYLIPAAQKDDIERIKDLGHKLCVMTTAGGIPADLHQSNRRSKTWLKRGLDIDEQDDAAKDAAEDKVAEGDAAAAKADLQDAGILARDLDGTEGMTFEDDDEDEEYVSGGTTQASSEEDDTPGSS